jgi:simple sugar transport system substrate-binding protein
MSRKSFSFVLALALLLLGVVQAVTAQDAKKVYYWISHGQASDPIWSFAQQGADRAGKDLGVEVRTSFHGGNVAAHKEAFLAAVAAGASGIATSSPQPGALTDAVAEAKKAGIPVVFFNTDDPESGRDAYVGADNVEVGVLKAKYLVDNNLIKAGDFVFMPVEVPGATYGTDQTKGIASVFDPLGIKYEVVDAQYDPAKATVNMVDYLTANKDKVKAIIGLGDLVTQYTKVTFDQVGIKPGEIPVVGWGNSLDTAKSVKEGYVNAAMWQYPDAQGYMAIVLLNTGATGGQIGYNILTMHMYDKTDVDVFIKALGG